MSQVRDLIRSKIKERGLSMKELSENTLKMNHAYLYQFLEKEKPKKLPEDMRALLAPALGLVEADLREGSQLVLKRRDLLTPKEPPQGQGRHEMLKVLGMAEGGPDGWSLWNGEVIETIRRPDNLIGVPGAYAVYITGSSMDPRFNAGELAHIHPGKPVTPGCYVLVQKKPKTDGETPLAVIKRLVRRSGSKVTLEQITPARTFEIRTDEIVSMHRVVGSSEA